MNGPLSAPALSAPALSARALSGLALARTGRAPRLSAAAGGPASPVAASKAGRIKKGARRHPL